MLLLRRPPGARPCTSCAALRRSPHCTCACAALRRSSHCTCACGALHPGVPAAVAALVIALFPRMPASTTDHRCHLQVCRGVGWGGGLDGK